MTRHIFVTGGVVSSLGKGLTSASIGMLLERRGLKVRMQNLDPYINVDPGTMSPYQHGEVYVLDDGSETDLDLGHYERFTSSPLNRDSNYTTGQIYQTVIQKERRGEYLGRTVQVVPHITDEIKQRILSVAHDVDVVICEIGGTVGDIESLPFLEAIRQFRFDVNPKNVLYIHLTLVPYIQAADELKTKPTQHSVQKLREIGIQPDILLCRTEKKLELDIKKKIGLFCNLETEAVITAIDVESIYQVPLRFHNEGLDRIIREKLSLPQKKPDLTNWLGFNSVLEKTDSEVRIAIVGKYVDLKESYKSLCEALIHGGVANQARVKLVWLSAEDLEEEGEIEQIKNCDGVLVPGGFGDRGFEGKVNAAHYAREHKVPYFGICLGMHCAVVEFARNVAQLAGAHSAEFEPDNEHPIIALMSDQVVNGDKGGTMRLGEYPCQLRKNSIAFKAYGSREVKERHRHRYEFNNKYRFQLEEAGLEISGISPNGNLVEIVELADHPWYLAGQFHPEFKSSPHKPHPLFRDFIAQALVYRDSRPA